MTARLRVVLVGAGMIPIPPPEYGAVEKHIWNLGQALERAGHDVSIVNEVVGARSVDEYRFAMRARKIVRGLAYDVLHLHTPGVAAVFSALGPRRFVYTTHSRHWATVERLGERVGFALERRAVRAARETIAVSPLVARAMVEIRRPHVIPNGVDVDRYRPGPTKTGHRLIGLGEIAPHKAWLDAAEAIRGTPWTLTLVGPIRDPPYATAVERAAPGQVRVTGPVSEDELVEALASSDAQVHPSLSESFGMAVLEGMSVALPIVAGDVVKDLVRDGETGFVVPAGLSHEDRVSEFRKRLDLFLADPVLRLKMGRAARERAVAEFSWDVVASKVAEVYRASLTEV